MNPCYRQSPLLVVLLLLLSSCATLPQQPAGTGDWLAYDADPGDSILRRYLPVFLIERPHESYNRLGTPRARLNPEKEEEVFIDPDQATIYTEVRRFSTPKDSYTNLIYRIHFSKVPFELPFSIGYGHNVGDIVVVTLNSAGQPLLYTTVQSCGCYLAFIPTTYLAADAFPAHWPREGQIIYGRPLPGLLDLQDRSPAENVTLISIEDGSHRVRDLQALPLDALPAFQKATARMEPLTSLENIPLDDGGFTSFYENSGPEMGFVKGSCKPWERLLMSWWALDWRVGQDKKLGRDKEDGPVFYTSLKPWARDDSDMRSFADFLDYWGWDL